MVTIVSSAINTGKSTFMRKLFADMTGADGFVCIKTIHNDIHTGYNLLHLPSARQISFIRKLPFIEPGWREIYQIGENYSFSETGFEFAQQIVDEAISKKVSHFFLDEVGPLELQDKGFAEIFRRLLKEKIDLTIAVRSHLLDKVCEKFNLTDYKILTPWNLGA